MAKVTTASDPIPAAASSVTTSSGKVVVFRTLTLWDEMQLDDLALDEKGNPTHFGRLPKIYMLAAIESVDGVPFGPIRTSIDVQKWASKLSGQDGREMYDAYLSRNSLTPDKLKNGSTAHAQES